MNETFWGFAGTHGVFIAGVEDGGEVVLTAVSDGHRDSISMTADKVPSWVPILPRIGEVVVFNATPHPITFGVGGDETVTVPSHGIISAEPAEEVVHEKAGVIFVQTVFRPTTDGHRMVSFARACGADIVVGSIIAAQAYPGEVVSMTPLPGFERRPPAEKRMNPRKFNTFA